MLRRSVPCQRRIYGGTLSIRANPIKAEEKHMTVNSQGVIFDGIPGFFKKNHLKMPEEGSHCFFQNIR
jgi:hypothetical protein